MDDLAGQLHISLAWEPGGWRVDIGSSRPLAASRVFIGKPVDEVARQLPRLYSLCATAQSLAFATATEQALGLTPDSPTLHLRQQRLRAERIKEHLWRLLLDWPPLLGLPPDEARMARIMQAYQRLRSGPHTAVAAFIPGASLPTDPGESSAAAIDEFIAQAQQASLGMPASAWLDHCAQSNAWQVWVEDSPAPAAQLAHALSHHCSRTFGQAATAFLNNPDLVALDQCLGSSSATAFIAAPDIHGQCQETTPLARMATQGLIADLIQTQGISVVTRLAALLVELARNLVEIATAMDAPPPLQAASPAPGIGLAAVDAARGLLIHRVILNNGCIRNHQVVAPTEWNFHPRGLLFQALRCLPAPDQLADTAELETLIHLLVTAIDPCVRYSLTCKLD